MMIIFLHGFPFNKSAWDGQINRLSSSYKVQAIDLRGHGKAPSPPGPWMIPDFAEDIKNYIEGQKLKKVVLCGLSMGGYIALHFAATYPQYLSGLILCNTRADADSNETKDKRYESIKDIRNNGIENFAEEFSRKALGETSLNEKPELQKQVKEMILQNSPSNICMTLGALASRRDSTSYLSKINCPTLVLTGSEDRIVPPEVTESMSQKIPGAHFHKIPGAGHLSNLENPSIFDQNLMQFLLAIKI